MCLFEVRLSGPCVVHLRFAFPCMSILEDDIFSNWLDILQYDAVIPVILKVYMNLKEQHVIIISLVSLIGMLCTN